MVSKCLAKQFSDQMYCSKCGLTWDMNDGNPPNCIKVDDLEQVDSEEVKKAKKNGWITS